MPISSINFNDLPKKVLIIIFDYLTQNERQLKREVCRDWDRIITEEFPVELTITNANYERLFRCGNAQKVIINSLTEEYMGKVAFGNVARRLEITGRVLSTNLIKILPSCQNLEFILFSSLKQVIGIQNAEVFGLPKLTHFEIQVRADQETFTSDEMILINALRNWRFDSLQTILISVRDFFEWEDDDDTDDLMDQSSEGFTLDHSRNNIELPLSIDTSSQTFMHSLLPVYPSLQLSENLDPLNTQAPIIGQNTTNSVPNVITDTETNAAETPGNVVRVFADASTGRTVASSSNNESTYSRLGEFDFATRMLNTRLQLQFRSSPTDLDSFLNDPTSGVDFSYRPNPFVANLNDSGLKPTVFFEMIKNNAEHLRTFIVKAKSDFVCFGDVSAFSKDFQRIQLEDVEYSFGRSQKLCMEFPLLQAQKKLYRLKLHILDDMWESVMIAAHQSRETMSEMDLKILSLSEDPIDLLPLSRCKALKVLKLFHFFDKESLNLLPISLTKLVLNGPVNKEDLKNFTVRLENLVEFTLILNTLKSDTIDKNLFQLFTLMPKILKLVFIQSQIDVKEIFNYCQQNPSLHASVAGPKELPEPFSLNTSIQYVVINVDEDFPRRPLATHS